MTEKIQPCGGCGETDPHKRCIGCLHSFYSDPSLPRENPVKLYTPSPSTNDSWSDIRAEVVRLKQREADLLAANNRYLQRARDAEASRDRLKAALQRIARWFGEFPDTGKFWDNAQTQPMSYSACYGSNGERDFMRGIARKALDDEEAEPI